MIGRARELADALLTREPSPRELALIEGFLTREREAEFRRGIEAAAPDIRSGLLVALRALRHTKQATETGAEIEGAIRALGERP